MTTGQMLFYVIGPIICVIASIACLIGAAMETHFRNKARARRALAAAPSATDRLYAERRPDAEYERILKAEHWDRLPDGTDWRQKLTPDPPESDKLLGAGSPVPRLPPGRGSASGSSPRVLADSSGLTDQQYRLKARQEGHTWTDIYAEISRRHPGTVSTSDLYALATGINQTPRQADTCERCSLIDDRPKHIAVLRNRTSVTHLDCLSSAELRYFASRSLDGDPPSAEKIAAAETMIEHLHARQEQEERDRVRRERDEAAYLKRAEATYEAARRADPNAKKWDGTTIRDVP